MTLLRLEYSGVILAYCSLDFPSLSDSPVSASQGAGTTGMWQHTQLIFFKVETRFLYIAQAGLKLLSSGSPPAITSQSAQIVGVSLRPARYYCLITEFSNNSVR
uniref:Uncharacterized protein n=1 Tax=Callithrix jacchus TaxID=9483 RepID=A0A5F4VZR4_CALJA